jgi:hypothetical protein
VIGLVAAVSGAYASRAQKHAMTTACSAPQPNRVLRVVRLTTSYRCSVASTLVRRVLDPKGCGLSYNEGFTLSTCRFRVTGRKWMCASIAHPNYTRRAASFFDVGCTSYSPTPYFAASTQFDLRGFAR